MARASQGGHYEVVVIETVSKHKTRAEASAALAKLPSRRRALGVVLEFPSPVLVTATSARPIATAGVARSASTKKLNPNLKLKKTTKRK